MREGQESMLRGAGVSADAAAVLAARLDAEASALPLDADAPDADSRLLLGAAIVAAQDARLLADALEPLLDALDARDLPRAVRGILEHLTGVLRWRRDADVGGALKALNHSAVLLDGEAPYRAYAGRVHDTLGQLLHHRGQPVDAREAYERALRLKREGGDTAGAALTLGNLGRLCLEGGDFAAAVGHLSEDLAFIEKEAPDHTRVRGQLETQLAICHAELGDLSKARTHIARAHELADSGDDDVGRAFAAVYAGRFELQPGPGREASTQVARAREALAQLPPDGMPELRGLVDELEAEIALQDGRALDALPVFERASAHFEHAGHLSPIERARFLAGWARALGAAGDRTEAVARLRAALRALDAASASERRQALEQELRALDANAWLLHGAGRFVGHDLIERLLHEGGLEGFRGQERDLTVLFSDLRGFTRVSEVLAPDALIDLLNRYLEAMTRCVEHHGGQVDKFIGDAVMALYAPSAHDPDEADRAVASARYMQAELDRFNRTLPPGVKPLRAGIGLHAGPVVAGIIGSPQKRSFTVIGDAVNTASRLEGMTKALDASILVSEAVRERLRDPERWLLVPLGAWRPKGRRRAVEVYSLAGARNDAAAARTAAARVRDAATGHELFRARSFDRAASQFRALADASRPGEGGAAFRRLAEASLTYQRDPPDTDWDAAIELLEK